MLLMIWITCRVQHRIQDINTGSILLVGHIHNGLYRFDLSTFQKSRAVVSFPATAHVTNLAPPASSSIVFDLWYRRLGHPCNKAVATVLRKCNVVANNSQLSSVCSVCSVCSACQLEKFHRLHFPPFSTVYLLLSLLLLIFGGQPMYLLKDILTIFHLLMLTPD
ncbi:uncharacterized protein LOC105767590 [Gossypium raimondii]|uniref:uncharacterized protein LOC105767590 n=1 Tax=Gossypium raimondii TaxID=29730 RepID=UPI00063A9338|nr:uncharacterized protein LOC105767590 [Gossypium raimondii]